MKQSKELLELELRFSKFHSQLLDLKQWKLANEISEIYHRTQYLEYQNGIDFMKKIYKL